MRGNRAAKDKDWQTSTSLKKCTVFYHYIRHQRISIIHGFMRGRTIVYLELSVVFLCI